MLATLCLAASAAVVVGTPTIKDCPGNLSATCAVGGDENDTNFAEAQAQITFDVSPNLIVL
ncbi:hypothetical protein N7452_011428 [Penicillium brevicompactum]|uniref:Uncharacterized protein n=1 Tax=Penicillium brevicompactum TaxID=5074 RepID=A0A9W9Q2I8_PENBR|nr:hypothetical protein N7452_011428 [Penicillium brevicompactum]